jgi:hypothetical protein
MSELAKALARSRRDRRSRVSGAPALVRSRYVVSSGQFICALREFLGLRRCERLFQCRAKGV